MKGRPVRPLRFGLLLLAGLYPFALVLGEFLGIEPLDWSAVMRALAVSSMASLLLYWAARVVVADPDARALWVSVILLGLGAYVLVLNILLLLGLPLAETNPLVAITYVATITGAATLVVRPWQPRRRDLVPMAIVAATLIAVNFYNGVARVVKNSRVEWQSSAQAISGAATRPPGAVTTNTRDIYYIVLDGLGRQDTLLDHYGLDVRDFAGFLQSRGFLVANHARSNYAHTLLSLSSFLNLGYLNPLGDVMGRESRSWLPLADMVQDNALMRLAKESGYDVVGIGSSYTPTRTFRQADICYCKQTGLELFEQVVIDQTPLVALPLDPWTHGSHHRKTVDAFSTLEHLPPAQRGRFILAHILAPHPPFTFAADGAFRRPDRVFMFNEGSDFRGSRDEYVRGYRDQATYIIRRLREVVEAVLNRPGPPPVIVIHGDHGPGSMLELNDAKRTNLAERMNIFAAYYFPDGQTLAYDAITPVNGARALANNYLGTNLPFLPDVSWFSTANHPFDFTTVPAEPGALRK